MLSYKKHITASMALLFIVWAGSTQGVGDTLGIASAHAQAASNLYASVAQLIAMVLAFFHFFIFLCLKLIGILMDTQMILNITSTPGAQSGEAVLQTVWRTSRDIVNIIFAFMLIAGAVMTVVMAKGDIIKQYVFKFVLAVILVNFSWFFPRVIWDIANIMTATVYQLPAAAANFTCTVPDEAGTAVPCKTITDIKFMLPHAEQAPVKVGDKEVEPDSLVKLRKDLAANVEWKCPLDEKDQRSHIVCYKMQELTQELVSEPLGLISGVVVNFGRVQELIKVQATAKGATANADDQLSQILTFVVHEMFILILHIGILFPLVAIVLVLCVRIVVIWMTIAFMPFMFVGFVFGPVGNFDLENMIFKKFIKAVFLPTVIAIPFAIGFIMLNAVGSSSGNIKIPGLEDGIGNLLPTVTSVWQLVWMFLSIFIIWEGVFMAMRIDEIYDKIGSRVKATGTEFGKKFAGIPLNLPIVPLPGGAGRVRMADIPKAAMRMPDAIAEGKLPTSSAEWKDFIDESGRRGGGGKGGAPTLDNADANRIARSLHNAKQTTTINTYIQDLNRGTPSRNTTDALKKIARDNKIEYTKENMQKLFNELKGIDGTLTTLSDTGFNSIK